jgi:hypothetical protein
MTTPRHHKNLRLTAITGALLALGWTHALATPAGLVEFAVGRVMAVGGDGRDRELAKGSSVESGDRVLTYDGRAQIRFTDGAFVSLAPNTDYLIKSYRYDGRADGSEQGVFTLVKGAVRTVSGMVGRVNKSAYRLETPTATIGIRGTGGVIAILGDGGTLLTGTSGVWLLSNAYGTIEVRAGSTGYAGPSGDRAPETIAQSAVLPVPSIGERPTLVAGTISQTPYAAGDNVRPSGVPTGVDAVIPGPIALVRPIAGASDSSSRSVPLPWSIGPSRDAGPSFATSVGAGATGGNPTSQGNRVLSPNGGAAGSGSGTTAAGIDPASQGGGGSSPSSGGSTPSGSTSTAGSTSSGGTTSSGAPSSSGSSGTASGGNGSTTTGTAAGSASGTGGNALGSAGTGGSSSTGNASSSGSGGAASGGSGSTTAGNAGGSGAGTGGTASGNAGSGGSSSGGNASSSGSGGAASGGNGSTTTGNAGGSAAGTGGSASGTEGNGGSSSSGNPSSTGGSGTASGGNGSTTAGNGGSSSSGIPSSTGGSGAASGGTGSTTAGNAGGSAPGTGGNASGNAGSGGSSSSGNLPPAANNNPPSPPPPGQTGSVPGAVTPSPAAASFSGVAYAYTEPRGDTRSTMGNDGVSRSGNVASASGSYELRSFDTPAARINGASGRVVDNAGSTDTIGWGRWVGHAALGGNGGAIRFGENGGLHYFTGTPTAVNDMPRGQALYNFAGATRPTLGNEQLAPGLLENGRMVVDFDRARVGVQFDVRFPAANTSYAVSTSGGLTDVGTSQVQIQGATFAGQGALARNAADCAAGCSTQISGGFVGPQAAGAGFAYQIRGVQPPATNGTPGGLTTINGAAAFVK